MTEPHTRYALVEIKTDHEWLTDSGDQTEDDGWDQIREEMRNVKIVTSAVTMTFDSWEDE